MENSKHLYIPGAIVLSAVIIAGTLLYTSGTPQQSLQLAGEAVSTLEVRNNGSTVEFEITDQDHIRGNINAPITILEFSDLECPFCSRFHPTVLQVLKEYGDQVRWIYRHFPLSIHPQAVPAALASECVAEQKGDEGFWQFVDTVFGQLSTKKLRKSWE